MKVGANGFRNEFFARTETDNFVLAKGEMDGLGRTQPRPHLPDLQFWGIAAGAMKSWIENCQHHD
eukprot:4169730-Pyramimonas_sp.AAC.1